jgi:hypothetical protein
MEEINAEVKAARAERRARTQPTLDKGSGTLKSDPAEKDLRCGSF